MKTIALLAILLLSGAPAYQFQDAVRDSGAGQTGIEDALTFVGMMNRIYEEYQSDRKSAVFFRFLTNAVQDFDFRSLYNSPFFKELKNGYRGVTFQAVSTPGVFDFRIVPHPDQTPAPEGFGSFVADYALRKNAVSPMPGIPSYSCYTESWIATERISSTNVSGLVSGLLKVVDPANLAKLNAARQGKGPSGKEPFDVIATLSKSFPNTVSFLHPYCRVLSKSVTHEYRGTSYTEFTLRAVLQLDNLRKHFPSLRRHLRGLRDIIRINLVLTNMQGHELARFVFDTQEDFITLAFCTRDGMIVPMEKTGSAEEPRRPVFKEAHLLTELPRYEWMADMALYSYFRGLNFSTENIRIKHSYESSPERTLFTMRLEGVGETKVTGLAYYVIPKWFINLFVPKDIETLCNDFRKVMVKANGGEGTFFRLNWDRSNPGANRVHYLLSTELLNNYYIRFAVNVARSRLKKDKQTDDELRCLGALTWRALLADLKTYRTPGSPAIPGAP